MADAKKPNTADAKKPNILVIWGADITSNTYWDWFAYKGYMIMAASAIVGKFLQTFKDFPPRQRAASFTIDQAIEKMEAALSRD
jgi:hypothetical protein